MTPWDRCDLFNDQYQGAPVMGHISPSFPFEILKLHQYCLHSFHLKPLKAIRSMSLCQAQLVERKKPPAPRSRPFEHNPSQRDSQNSQKEQRREKVHRWKYGLKSNMRPCTIWILQIEEITKNNDLTAVAVLKWFYFHVGNYFHSPPDKKDHQQWTSEPLKKGH